MGLLSLAHTLFESTEFGSDFLIEVMMLMIIFTFFEIVGHFTNTK